MTNDVPLGTRIAMNRRSKGRCEVCYIAAATDLHHRKRRREADHSLVNVLHLCRKCHSGVHARPEDSRLRGWLVRFCVEEPATVPVLYRGVWVMLTDEGEPHPTGG